MKTGYASVSSEEQQLGLQRNALRAEVARAFEAVGALA